MYKVNDRVERVLESYDSANTNSGYSAWIEAAGRKLGQLGADVKPCLENIEATFKCRKSRLTARAYDKLGTAKAQIVALEDQYVHLCQTIHDKKAALKIDSMSIPEYSLTKGIILLFATLIFLVAEFDLTIQTVASSLGLNIDIELIVEEPLNIENYGGFLLAAALGALCLILDLWLGPYIVEPFFRKERRSLTFFKWLILPVGILTFGLSLANAVLRWRFSEALFDPSVEIWRSLWTPSGGHSTFGLLFIIFLILSLQVCSALGLAFGHHHLRLFKKAVQYRLRRFCRNLKNFFILCPSLKKLLSEKYSLATQKHELQNFIDGFNKHLERWLSTLDTRREEMVKFLLSTYLESEKEAERQALQEKIRRPLHQYIRQQLITDITGEDYTQNHNGYYNNSNNSRIDMRNRR